jgi:hypothetical protein
VQPYLICRDIIEAVDRILGERDKKARYMQKRR